MAHITKLVIRNFKKFRTFKIDFDKTRNIILGDNEAGKSSILMAIELVLSGSKGRVESIGLENLMNVDCVKDFLALDNKTAADLPILVIELYLGLQEKTADPSLAYLEGVNHSMGGGVREGIKLVCKPDQERFGELIQKVLDNGDGNFPFEFYRIDFTHFSGLPYTRHTKALKYVTIDSSNINTDYAHSHYIKTIYEASVENDVRVVLQNEYRQQKLKFKDDNLRAINNNIRDYDFSIRSGSKYNLESDLTITQDSVPIESRGKGMQCFVKTEFALRKNLGGKVLDIILLEEPENHLSHTNMSKLINRIQESPNSQVIIATHNSLICTRLDLRRAILLNSASTDPLTLCDLDKKTAEFFMKTPSNNILEFVLSEKVILVEGDAEFMLIESMYEKEMGSTLNADGVHVISVGGTSFNRYMELARNLKIKVAVIRDNDGDYQKKCIEYYESFTSDEIRVFFDENNDRYTFEVCIYQDNMDLCDTLFYNKKSQKNILERMLDHKTETAFKLLDEAIDKVNTPSYILEAFKWIKG